MRLTDRDRQLLGVLATARMLSTEQLGRLMYPERSEFNLKKRLRALAGISRHGEPEGRPFLRRQTYRTWEGQLRSAWMPTELGYIAAESVLPEAPTMPRSDVGAAFVEHQLLLNELYVKLLEAPVRTALTAARARAARDAHPERAYERLKAPIYARAATPGLRWHTSDTVRLSWREYADVRNAGQRGVNGPRERQRLILPDAVVEFAERRQRYFLEAETGSHSVAAQSDEKRGTTLSKLAHYLHFVTGIAHRRQDGRGVTFYRAAYPDDFEPRVLFVVRSTARLQTLETAIDGWRKKHVVSGLWAHALTLDGAATDFLGRMGQQAPAAPPQPPRRKRELDSNEFRLVRGFFQSAVTVLHEARQRARARGEPVPAYPGEREGMVALLNRLTGAK